MSVLRWLPTSTHFSIHTKCWKKNIRSFHASLLIPRNDLLSLCIGVANDWRWHALRTQKHLHEMPPVDWPKSILVGNVLAFRRSGIFISFAPLFIVIYWKYLPIWIIFSKNFWNELFSASIRMTTRFYVKKWNQLELCGKWKMLNASSLHSNAMSDTINCDRI